MKINCIVIDDEPLAVQLLENHISKIEELHVIGTAQNALEAYKLLKKNPVDLIFLDINMPDLNGIDFLKSLHHKPKTIFTTAYREFAIEGFELEAVDYILKPITFERFFKAVERVLRQNPENKEEEFIILKSNGLQHKIALTDILFFESQGNDIKAVLKGKKEIAAKYKISDLEMNLFSKGFLRIHRSFLINQKEVKAIGNNELIIDNYSIPAGRIYKENYDQLKQDFKRIANKNPKGSSIGFLNYLVSLS
ncbi:response regulator transcription factor [Flavobacterium endoglycinae]|uniref:Response regulator transcription factor n=1 Tax=Flavobacterium endoglycinae TaxID=2816357 RepID=A0ABX7QJS0_9FLAO|nr:response regulator transcription factor [Flavobacterium endoglycinae]QSW91355.1 response regulator transcription factor [Flavobacterium endoglycinae]